MAYKPSPDPALDHEPFASVRRTHEANTRQLQELEVVGLSEAEARVRVEAAGLTFRPIRPDEVETADWCATRVTAYIDDGLVRDADIH